MIQFLTTLWVIFLFLVLIASIAFNIWIITILCVCFLLKLANSCEHETT